jgi:hypothetical protein
MTKVNLRPEILFGEHCGVSAGGERRVEQWLVEEGKASPSHLHRPELGSVVKATARRPRDPPRCSMHAEADVSAAASKGGGLEAQGAKIHPRPGMEEVATFAAD